METIYHMTCGCTLKNKELIRKPARLICSYHQRGKAQGHIKQIEKECCDCGSRLILKPMQYNTVRCDECKAEKKKEIDRTYYHNVVAPSIIKKSKRIKKTTKRASFKMDISLYTQGLSRYLPEQKECR